MVLKKINYGFNGFHVPTVPKAPRSARKKVSLRKTIDDGQMCAFELLASLAGKLLQESEISSASSNASEGNGLHLDENACNKQEQKKNDEDKSLIADSVNHGSFEESAFVPELGLPNRDVKFSSNGLPYDECDSTLACASMSNNSGSSKKLGGDLKPPVVCKLEAASGDSHGTENMVLCSESPVLVNSGCKVELPTCAVPVLDASFTRHKNSVKLGIRDDDEKFLRCTKSSTSMKYFRPMSRIGGRRIRKLLTSKYWKVAPKLTDYDIPRTDGRIKPLQYHKRKFCPSRERYHQYNSVYKRRKCFDRNSVVISDGGFSSESVSYLPEKAMKGYKTGVNGACCATMGPKTTFNSRDSHVQFSIRSFRVPELVIEVPETSTVRSLKKTVSEAVTAMLKGHLRVGVLLQGKKIRDDNRTLSQTGITCKENLESLGFSLEPDIVQASPSLCSDEPPVSLTCDTSLLISRYPVDFISDAEKSDTTIQRSNPPLLMNSSNNDEVNNETTILHTNTSTDTTIDYSRALVPIPAININPLAIVPSNQKPRRTEFVQRRIRRPFSVTEVEALVHAVEELGTGRWRDVKLRCFENADHRTYVDLKDKWKTLVHTAKIAPQQRRGEPVPQELLDRVLAAHGYWSEHQIRQHGKHQPGNPKITEAAHSD